MAATLPTDARAFLFDLDDTLVPWQTTAHWQWAWHPQGPLLSERHTRSAIKRAQHAWDRRRWDGLTGDRPPAEFSDYRQHLKETLAAIADRTVPAAEVEAVVDRFLKPSGGWTTFPDAGPTLDGLAARGDAVGIVTFLPEGVARPALRRAGLPDPRLVLHGEETGGPTLPSAPAFRLACSRLGARPSQTVYVGDLFWSDVRAAGRAGLTALLIDRSDAWPRVAARRIRSLRSLLDPLPPPGAPSGAPASPPEAPT
ncbi:MAG: HAD family hydrolase, partial [Thermoplasmata archaeon]